MDVSTERWALVAVSATALGIGYAWAIDRVQTRWPNNPYVWAEVVAGVLLIAGVALLVLPLEDVAVFLAIAGLLGVWQIGGEMKRIQDRDRQRREEQERREEQYAETAGKLTEAIAEIQRMREGR